MVEEAETMESTGAVTVENMATTTEIFKPTDLHSWGQNILARRACSR